MCDTLWSTGTAHSKASHFNLEFTSSFQHYFLLCWWSLGDTRNDSFSLMLKKKKQEERNEPVMHVSPLAFYCQFNESSLLNSLFCHPGYWNFLLAGPQWVRNM